MQGVSVAIAAYNEEQTIGGTLASLVAQNYPGPREILVCANACTDNTAAVVRAAQETSAVPINLIETKTKGKPNAWNLLREAARYNVLAFADADVIVGSGSLLDLVNTLGANPSACAAIARMDYLLEGADFFSKAICPPPGLPGGIVGRLYALKKDVLAQVLASKGYARMPDDVIHEDLWLSHVVGESKTVPAYGATAYAKPYHWREAYKMELRNARALKQMFQQYRHLVEFQVEHPLATLQRRVGKFFDSDNLGVALSKTMGFAVRRTLYFLANRAAAREYLANPLDGWEVSAASKTAFQVAK